MIQSIEDAIEFMNMKHAISRHTRESHSYAKEIKELLESHGVKNLFTNGYAYEFNYGNTHVSFVDQESRLCVTTYRNDIDIPCDVRMSMCSLEYKNKELYEQLKQDLRYENFIIDGVDSVCSTRKLMRSL
jgi:hypothetical protein